MTADKKTVFAIIFAYMITFAVFNIGGFEASDILLGVIFICFLMLFTGGHLFDHSGQVNFVSAVTASLWTLSYMIYAGDRLGGGMDNRLFAGTYSILTLAGVFVLSYMSVGALLDKISSAMKGESGADPLPAADTPDGSPKSDEKSSEAGSGKAPVINSGRFPWRDFLLGSLVVILCLIPLFLLNFPGTMTVDSFDQLEQVLGIYPYVDHHPWAHTLFIKLFFDMGFAVTGNMYGGIALYTIAQMLIIALAVGYAAVSVRESGGGRFGQAAVISGFVLYPYHLAYAITMWKDIVFSAAVLVMTVTVSRIACFDYSGETGTEALNDTEGYRIPVRDMVLFAISGVVMSLFRHNGFYVLIAVSAVMIFRYIHVYRMNRSGEARNNLIRISMIAVCVIGITLIFNGPVERAFGVDKVDFAHNIPIPLQQIARVVAYNGDISPEDMERIERINISSYLRYHYEPGGADNTMQWLVYGDSDYFEAHKPEYLALWIRLGIKNPHAYLEAYIDQTRGYYTTMMPDQKEYYGILPNNLELYPQPLIGGRVRFKINEISSKLGGVLPVYAMLYSPGAALMIAGLGIGILVVRDRKNYIYAYLPPLMLLLTVLVATPLRADMRYAYPLLLCLPYLLMLSLKKS